MTAAAPLSPTGSYYICGRERTYPVLPFLPVGTVMGERTLIEVLGRERRNGKTYRIYRVLCSCGRVQVLMHRDFVKRGRCASCAQRLNRRVGKTAGGDKTRDRCRALREAVEAWPQLWREDARPGIEACGELGVRMGGMALAEVAIVLGVSRQRVEQIEKHALAKLRKRMPAAWADHARSLTTWDVIDLLSDPGEAA